MLPHNGKEYTEDRPKNLKWGRKTYHFGNCFTANFSGNVSCQTMTFFSLFHQPLSMFTNLPNLGTMHRIGQFKCDHLCTSYRFCRCSVTQSTAYVKLNPSCKKSLIVCMATFLSQKCWTQAKEFMWDLEALHRSHSGTWHRRKFCGACLSGKYLQHSPSGFNPQSLHIWIILCR